MLNHPTQDKLLTLKLFGMAAALDEQRQLPACDPMSFEERLGLLVDREMTQRSNRQLAQRVKRAHLRQSAVAEDIDFRHARGLDRSLIQSLLTCDWIRRHDNCLITGPTGVGKSYLACALANQACRAGWRVFYSRAPRLFQELAIAHADGSFGRRLVALARTDLLLLDDWGTAPLAPEGARDLLELLDDRYDRKSTLVVSQLPVDSWHPLIGDGTLADATLDRLVHNAHRLALTGESMRKTRTALTTQDSRD
jgi:DNA replication protein DnaC